MFLDINNLSFGYSENLKILNNLTLSLAKGNTLAIIGSSGSGKSTLLRLIRSNFDKRANAK
jgi:ABC-type transport system involved in cytochrome bd biosynthesis fused ATPase/permease subunit